MKTVRVTTAEAVVRFVVAQRTVIDGVEAPLVPGAFAIFGHGNVTCLGPALHAAGDELPTWRGQNEQGMALAAIAYAKAMRRRQFMLVTSSIGPGALNMVTAAGVAMANRLPVLLLAGDTFQSRLPDPVLQQIERYGDPSATANDAFRPVVRYWDRITRPEQPSPRCSILPIAARRFWRCPRTSRRRRSTSRSVSSSRGCTRSPAPGLIRARWPQPLKRCVRRATR
jgi:3D-(3,5/4)-trihydroxycyclohexane-1,2-dione acylhydrolase (decyclizing)